MQRKLHRSSRNMRQGVYVCGDPKGEGKPKVRNLGEGRGVLATNRAHMT